MRKQLVYFTILNAAQAIVVSSVAFAVSTEDLGMRVNLKQNSAPNLKVQAHEIVGTCDGVKYTSQSELDGCVRIESARALTGNPLNPVSNISRPVPTTEEK